MTRVLPDGPIPARVMLVGEAPGAEEEAQGIPFVGASGKELTKMLHDAGVERSECFITNVARERPPGNDIAFFIAMTKKEITKDHNPFRGKMVRRQIIEGCELLKKEISLVKPNIIITFGNTPLWALTGEWGVTKWRGSMLYENLTEAKVKVIPTYHPAAVLRQWEWRQVAVQDIRRAAKYRDGRPYPNPSWNFTLRPDFATAFNSLTHLESLLDESPQTLSFDIETRAGHIACAGIAWTQVDAICIPLMCVERQDGYWTADEEGILTYHLYKVLTHPNAKVIGQNLLYDSQYTYRHWHFVPRVTQDSMISHHVAFAGLPKKLDFQASIYCESYRYWKDDSKNWDKSLGEEQLWRYNCEDCVRTYEVAAETAAAVQRFHLHEPHAFQQRLFWPVLEAMKRGVRIDTNARNLMTSEVLEELAKREEFFKSILGHPLNPRSPQQMQRLFYDDLKLPKIMNRATGTPTLNDDALNRIAAREPLVLPIVKAISEYRSLGVFLGTFIKAPLDEDQRMRCSYNICGTETYRFSSSENAFGSGTNLQNIPKGYEAKDPDSLSLPNIRKLFIPDAGYTFFDMDLDRADLQVVVWEADDAELKVMLREGVDIHAENAKVLGISRQLAKSWVHGTNYGGKPPTMAKNCGITIHQAERMMKRWFEAHPGIKSWHQRVETQLRSKRFVDNKFGYRRYYFERLEGILPEALAWIPQSTVACTINRIWMRVYDEAKYIQVLMQCHDSLGGQFPTVMLQSAMDDLKRLASIVIPYPDPLIIPVGIKVSNKSWGDVA